MPEYRIFFSVSPLTYLDAENPNIWSISLSTLKSVLSGELGSSELVCGRLKSYYWTLCAEPLNTFRFIIFSVASQRVLQPRTSNMAPSPPGNGHDRERPRQQTATTILRHAFPRCHMNYLPLHSDCTVARDFAHYACKQRISHFWEEMSEENEVFMKCK